MRDTHICATCGAEVADDWSPEHSEFHQEVRDLRTELDKLRRLVEETRTQ